MSKVDDRRRDLCRYLDDAITWATNPPADVPADVLPADPVAVDELSQRRRRAAEAMINVAFVGRFSSGKSVLVSALPGHVRYEHRSSPGNPEAGHYRKLLFSAARTATACPTTVAPVKAAPGLDTTGGGLLRVRFMGQESWTTIGNSQPPAVVAAYTAHGDVVENRMSEEHRRLTVAEAEILINDWTIPAKLYDLPGFGSLRNQGIPNLSTHEGIARRAWNEADCFVFVTRATHSIGNDEDQLIGELYKHHLQTGKRVIWVVTAIDSEFDIDEVTGKTSWKMTVESNNEYLRDYLRDRLSVPLRELQSFIGTRGFIGVSPFWEAKADWYASNGDLAMAEELRAASQMGMLRGELAKLIETTTGHQHLDMVVSEVHSILRARHSLVQELFNTARRPLVELAAERSHLIRKGDELRDAIPSVRKDLTALLDGHLRRVSSTFGELARYLHDEMNAVIRSADVTKEREANRVAHLRDLKAREWIVDSGPQQAWNRERDGFLMELRESVSRHLGDSHLVDPAQGLVDLDALRVLPSRRYTTSKVDFVEQASKFLGLSSAAAGVLITALGLVSGPFLALPAGATVASGIVYGFFRKRSGRATALDALRNEWIQELPDAAEQIRDSFLMQARAVGIGFIDRAEELLEQRVIEYAGQVRLAQSRLAEPDKFNLRQVVTALDPYCAAGGEILKSLVSLSSGTAS